MDTRHPAAPPTGAAASSGQRWALVLAGGDGKRLRPLTGAIAGRPIPKQYCRMLDEGSLLELTLRRICPIVPPERTLVIVNHDHLTLAKPQLRGIPSANVIVQPRNLDTGPGMALSLATIAQRDAAARVCVFPSDHWVENEPMFLVHVLHALAVIEHRPDLIALLGIPPSRPDSGFGWIETADAVPKAAPARYVARFLEKPDATLAATLRRRGCLWNSFVMALRVDRALDRLRVMRPEVLDIERALGDPQALAAVYAGLPAWNFSHEFLADRPAELAVVPAPNTGWDDWGTPEAIEHAIGKRPSKPTWWHRRPALAATA